MNRIERMKGFLFRWISFCSAPGRKNFPRGALRSQSSLSELNRFIVGSHFVTKIEAIKCDLRRGKILIHHTASTSFELYQRTGNRIRNETGLMAEVFCFPDFVI